MSTFIYCNTYSSLAACKWNNPSTKGSSFLRTHKSCSWWNPQFLPKCSSHMNVQCQLQNGQDPGALLRYALPIDNKAIREVQKPLEDITESLKIAGAKALDSVERNARQASRSLKQGKSLIISGLAESKKGHGMEFLDKLDVGMEELQQIVEDRNRDAVAPKQKELLQYVGDVEEDMVDGFPFEIPEEYHSMPLLKGRAAMDMKVKVKDNPNLEECVFHIVLDGYNAPVTKFPFNAFGTMAMARDEFEDNSASSQVFWLLKETELTPTNANILDGRYAENQDFLADLKVGDVIESIQVVSGLENLVNPSYKIALVKTLFVV